MHALRSALSRRRVLWGGALVLSGIGSARAQTPEERSRKIQAWVDFTIRNTVHVTPMSNGYVLDFPTEQVQRRQIALARDGVDRALAVVVPYQRDGIILAAGKLETRSFNVHRTGTHLRRIASARNVGGATILRWSGSECDVDFEAQIAFWVAQRIN